MKRIMEYLDSDELENYITYFDIASDLNNDVILKMENVDLSWTPNSVDNKDDSIISDELKNKEIELKNFNSGTENKDSTKHTQLNTEKDNSLSITNKATQTLRNINFSINRGQLVAIVGPVVIGKSSMLSSILG